MLSICRDAETTDDEVELSCSPTHRETCGTFYYAKLDGKPPSGKLPVGKELPIDRLTLGCKAGEPTIRVTAKTRHLDVPAEDLDFSAKSVMTGDKCTGPRLK